MPVRDEARTAVKRIANKGHRAAEVVQRIRSLFKNDGQNRVLLDVNQLIREVLALVQGDLLKHRISVDIELNENLPQVMADRAQLQQVVMNLVMEGRNKAPAGQSGPIKGNDEW